MVYHTQFGLCFFFRKSYGMHATLFSNLHRVSKKAYHIKVIIFLMERRGYIRLVFINSVCMEVLTFLRYSNSKVYSWCKQPCWFRHSVNIAEESRCIFIKYFKTVLRWIQCIQIDFVLVFYCYPYFDNLTSRKRVWSW